MTIDVAQKFVWDSTCGPCPIDFIIDYCNEMKAAGVNALFLDANEHALDSGPATYNIIFSESPNHLED